MREQKSPLGEGLHLRPNAIRTRSLAIIPMTCSFLVLQGIANADAGDKKAGPIQIKAHFEETPDHFDMMPPCSASTSVPRTRACRGPGRNNELERITGDWQGQGEYTYGFFILPSGYWYGDGVERFTGEIRGCGTSR